MRQSQHCALAYLSACCSCYACGILQAAMVNLHTHQAR